MEDIFTNIILFIKQYGDINRLMRTCKLLSKIVYSSNIWDTYTFYEGMSTYNTDFHKKHGLSPYEICKLICQFREFGYKKSFNKIINEEKLILSGKTCKNTHFPKNFEKLSQLQELHLCNSQIRIIPKEIGKMTKLTSLDLSNNYIKIVPDELGELINLTYLCLSDNLIQILPPKNLGKLVNLRKLHLHGNKIKIFWVAIKNLTNLICLELSNNEIKIIPQSITKLIKLEQLYLSGNKNDTFPKCDHLKNLVSKDF